MILCTNCKWHEPSSSTDEINNYDKCIFLTNKDKQISLVDGKERNKKVNRAYCEEERKEGARCGPEANYYDPKQVVA